MLFFADLLFRDLRGDLHGKTRDLALQLVHGLAAFEFNFAAGLFAHRVGLRLRGGDDLLAGKVGGRDSAGGDGLGLFRSGLQMGLIRSLGLFGVGLGLSGLIVEPVDLGLTLEYLETQGVPVLGLRTDELPAFYCRTSGFKLDYNCPDEATVAKIMKTKWDIGLKGGAIVGNPVPEQYAMDPVEMNKVIDRAVEMAKEQGIHGKATTPFLLAHIVEMTGGHSLDTNIQLAFNNARAASKIAKAYAEL